MRELPQLPERQTVWVETRGQQTPGRVVQAANTPRYYTVETPTGQVRRNSTHLRIRTEVPMSTAEEESPTMPNRPVTRTQLGTVIRPPDRLRF